MKKASLIMAILLIFSISAYGQMGQGMMGHGMAGEPQQQQQGYGWGYPGAGGMGYGMMGPGMMGGGMMGGGMMGMMQMMGMGGMMGQGMGPGMMNPYHPQMRKFLDETIELRKEILLKRFDYFEATRKPDTPVETITKLQEELKRLTLKLQEKAPLGFQNW